MAKQVVGKAAFQVPGAKRLPRHLWVLLSVSSVLTWGSSFPSSTTELVSLMEHQFQLWFTVYSDRSFEFITKSPPASALLKMAAGIASGSGEPHKVKVGKVSREQVDEICKKKMADLNARDLEHARRMIEGTARSMGIEVVG